MIPCQSCSEPHPLQHIKKYFVPIGPVFGAFSKKKGIFNTQLIPTHTTNQPTNQPANQPTNQTTNQPNRPTNPTNPTQPNPTQPNPTQPNPTQPNPTQPNPTQPNPTQPNPTQPNPTQPNPTQPNQPTQPFDRPTKPATNQPTKQLFGATLDLTVDTNLPGAPDLPGEGPRQDGIWSSLIFFFNYPSHVLRFAGVLALFKIRGCKKRSSSICCWFVGRESISLNVVMFSRGLKDIEEEKTTFCSKRVILNGKEILL